MVFIMTLSFILLVLLGCFQYIFYVEGLNKAYCMAIVFIALNACFT